MAQKAGDCKPKWDKSDEKYDAANPSEVHDGKEGQRQASQAKAAKGVLVGEVVDLELITRLDIDPDRVLEKARGELGGVIVIGYDKEGGEYFASSYADGGTALWLIERCKKRLLDMPEEM